MNQDIKQRWVTALRSGEFEQGKDHLSKNGKFCCLGVLCELAVKDGVIEPGEPDRFDSEILQYGEEREGGHLPEAVAKWAGLVSEDTWGEYDDQPMFDFDPVADGKTLSEWNDGGSTFAELADLIEEKL